MLKFARYLVIGIAFCLAVLVVNLGLSSPIYPDEFAYLKVNARIINDSWHVSTLFPFCASSQNLSIPLSLIPGALVAQSVLGSVEDTKVLRMVGTAIFLFFGLFLAAIAWLSRKEGGSSHALLPAILPLLLGVFPFIGVLTRPEITINACAALLLILFLLNRYVKNTLLHNLGYCALFSIISSFLMLQHPKSVFFVPYVALVAWLVFRNRSKWAFAVAGIFVSTLSIQAYSIFKKKMFCPEIPPEAISIFNNYLDPLQLFSSPMSFLSEVFFNFGTFSHYIDSILFQQNSQVRWLPSIELFSKYPMYIGANLLISISYVVFFAMLLTIIAAHFHSFIRKPRQAPSSALVLLLVMPAFAVAGLQTTKNFYDSSFIFPLCSLVLVFGIGSLEKNIDLLKKLTTRVTLLFAIVAIDSQVVTLYTFSQESFSQQLEGPSLSHQRFQEIYETASFQEAVEGCQLHTGPETERLALDDLMYFKFKDSKNPIFITYFLVQLWIKGPLDPVDFIPNLRKAGATGAIAACSSIPEGVRMYMRNYNGFCCLKESDIKAGTLRR